jgi:hypothetical protein
MGNRVGVIQDGALRVWRHQRPLWWMFLANLCLAAMGALPVSQAVAPVANHSLYADRILSGFDITAFSELAANPEVHLRGNTLGTYFFSLLFFLLTLFLNGGILETYRLDRRMRLAEFSGACGAFFWRWVRLLLCMMVVLAPVGAIASGVHRWSSRLSSEWPQERLGFWVEVAGMLFVWFLMMGIRLWFDVAQVQTVVSDEPSMLRAARNAFWVVVRNCGSLFWLYFRITLLAWVGLLGGVGIWSKMPPEHFLLSFVLWELVLFLWTVTRLWQRAAETAWYERYAALRREFDFPFGVPAPLTVETPPV